MNSKNKIWLMLSPLIVMILGAVVSCNGQKQEHKQILEQKLISKNESVSNYPLANIVNYDKSNAKVSDFKGKLLILDYWFIGCAPCIKSFPKLMQLQEKFGDKIQIMLVNHMQSIEDVEPFLQNWETKNNTKFTLPSVTSDTILYKVMPPSGGYPTMVWIDKEGVYRASSRSEDFNEETITAFLKGDIEFQEKTVSAINLLRTYTPLYVDDNGTTVDDMLWFSTVTRETENIRPGMELMVSDEEKEQYYIIVTTDIKQLIRLAYNDVQPQTGSRLNASYLPNSRCYLNTSNPDKYNGRKNEKGLWENWFTYQLISKQPKSKEELKRVMQTDLENYFDLDMSWKEMEKECYVLTAKDTTLISDFKNDEQWKGNPWYSVENPYGEDELMKLTDVTPDELVHYLSNYKYYQSPYPIVNETGFNGKMDLKLPSNSIDKPDELNAYLWEHYKMKFTIQKREVRVLEIKEREKV